MQPSNPKNSPIPARLHVLLAAKSPIGIVIRRGPSKQVCTVLWNRHTDTFTLGQWLKGRIYERRCDLSPNGKYFLYFAMNARRNRKGPPCWTAVSRTPWLRALALYGDEETWLGGGRFLDNKIYSVNGGPFFHVLHESKEVIRKQPVAQTSTVSFDELAKTSKYPITEDFGVYLPRLEREGWTLMEKGRIDKNSGYYLFEKPVSGKWALQKTAHSGGADRRGKGVYWDEHALVNYQTGISLPFPDWEWADVDGSRLVWACEGKLRAGKLNKEGLYAEQILYDFNDMVFQEIKAPY